MKRTAVLSECGTFRFQLTRGLERKEWSTTLAGGFVAWVLNNPSTADADIDDPTSRRCWAFTQAWGYGNMMIVNTNPFRATDPVRARNSMPHERILVANDSWLRYAQGQSPLVVCGWGDKANPELALRAVKVLHAVGPLHVLGVTQAGNPRHPLYQPGDLKPTLWRPTACLH